MTAQRISQSDIDDIEAAMANDAVTSLTRYAPSNNAPYHDATEDERLLENARRQAPWIRSIIAASVAGLQ